MRRTRIRAVALAGLTGLTLASCAPGPVIDRVPETLGGLPAGAPARPQNPYQYPAVHDMPPPRANAPLSEAEQIKLEKDLEASRDRQSSATRDGPAPAKPANARGSGAKPTTGTGAKPNP